MIEPAGGASWQRGLGVAYGAPRGSGAAVRLLVHLLGHGPEPLRGFGVERVGGDPGGVGAGGGRVVGGVFLAVLEVPADHAAEPGRGSHVDAGGRALGERLEGVPPGRAERVELRRVVVAGEVGVGDRPRVQGVDLDPVIAPEPGGGHREQHVRGLGLGVCQRRAVRADAEVRGARDLPETTRAPPAARSAGSSPTASRKWPRWLVANCSSCPSGLRRSSGTAITPALLTRMCSGPARSRINWSTEPRSSRSSRATETAGFPVAARMSAAVRSAAARSRAATTVSAPAEARARAVSTPMPLAAPVTRARRPCRSMPAITSAAVDSKPNEEVTRVVIMRCPLGSCGG